MIPSRNDLIELLYDIVGEVEKNDRWFKEFEFWSLNAGGAWVTATGPAAFWNLFGRGLTCQRKPKIYTITDAAIAKMVDRFLEWPLPKSFNPDNGIVIRDDGRITPPVGTNLLNAEQAREMILYMLETDRE